MKHLRHAASLSTVKAAGLCLLLLLGHAFGGNAQELRIKQVKLDSPNQVTITYDSEAGAAYVLLYGYSVTNISTTVATNSGIAGSAFFTQTVATTNRESYYRIARSVPPPAPQGLISEPASGANEVGLTVRPRAFFPKPIDPSTLNSNNFYAAFAGTKLPARIVPANDGKFAWLFFDPTMPSASQITVTVDGATITNADGTMLDADADGAPGGVFTFNFSTVSVAPVPNTVLSSRVVDPGPDLIPRTADDVTSGAGGFNYLLPIQGVKVYLLGMENNVAYTDADGRFTLTNMPVGDVKVVLDGRTATSPPRGYYFPEMVMDTTFAPGITNGVMSIVDTNGVVVRDSNGVPIRALAQYLPRVASNVLQTVNAGLTNLIMLQSNAAYTLSPTQQQYLTVEIMPNSLIGMNGQPLATGQVGVSVVPPELVGDMLPPGLLQHTFDITVQAPGISTFATPAPMTFPNVFNASPGTKLNFLSFDHTTGRLVIEGTATVSEDGLFVHTDPGTGITHPGWHGLAPPGVNASTDGCSDGGDGGCGGGSSGPNGCGPSGSGWNVIKTWVINGFPCSLVFLQACNNHDNCYATCGPNDSLGNKKNCDDKLRQELVALCDLYSPGNPLCDDCAELYYQAVKRGGDSAFRKAQRESGCDCNPSIAKARLTVDTQTKLTPRGPYYFAIADTNGETIVLRGSGIGDEINHRSLFLAANTTFRFWILELETLREGYLDFTTPGSGTSFQLPPVPIWASLALDLDNDGLSDVAEGILGTDLLKPDTDDDGLSDLAEVQQGLDPLSGRGFPSGVIASLPLPGEAKEVVLEGSILDSQQQIAYLALGSRGLGIINASQFQKPILLGQLDLPGDATDVAVDSNLRIAAVAANAGGLHLINVADSMQPALVQTINLNASQVEVIGGVAYVVAGADLWSYDLASRTLLQPILLGGATLTGLASEGLFLYTMDSSRVLRAIDLHDGTVTPRGSLTMPAGGGKIFVGNGIAYVAAGAGFATANVSDPDQLQLLSGVDAANIEGTAVAANGSGLAIAVGSVNGPTGPILALDVLNVSDPANTAAFLTRFGLPAAPFSVAIGAGIAFVADGTAGLQVVNYRSFDNQGVPPTVTLTNSFTMLTPTNALVEEGKLMVLAARTTDDVQVRNVEFYIDGVKVATDGNFPFENRFLTPRITATKTNFIVRAKATDTGGNFTWSEIIDVALTPDITPPLLRQTFPTNYAVINITNGVNTLFANFSEPIDQSTVTPANFFVVTPGLDNRLGTADDLVLTNGIISFRDTLNVGVITFPNRLPLGLYRLVVGLRVRDLVGNLIASPGASTFAVLNGGPDDDDDGDDLINSDELKNGTNPLVADTDGDGWIDSIEVDSGSDPLDANSRPDAPWVAQPIVDVLLPSPDMAGTSGASAFLAQPPVQVDLPSPDAIGISGVGFFLGQPPVSVQLPSP